MSPRHARSRAAFALADAAVGCGLLGLVIGLLLTALPASQHGEASTDRNHCLVALLHAQQQVESDLARLVRRPGHEPVSVPEGAVSDSLGFWIFDAGGRETAGVPTRAVAYRVEPRGVMRLEDGQGARLAAPHLRGIRFGRWKRSTGEMLRVTLTARSGSHQVSHAFLTRLRVAPGWDPYRLDTDPGAFPASILVPPRIAPED